MKKHAHAQLPKKIFASQVHDYKLPANNMPYEAKYWPLTNVSVHPRNKIAKSIIWCFLDRRVIALQNGININLETPWHDAKSGEKVLEK